jgi:hypothetical protein
MGVNPKEIEYCCIFIGFFYYYFFLKDSSTAETEGADEAGVR